MKRVLFVVLLVVMLTPAFGIEVDVAGNYSTRYMFRGERLVDNAVVSPMLTLKMESLELSAASIYDVKKDEVFRHVYQLTFKTQINKIGLDTGFVRYDPRKGADATTEFFAKASWKGNWQPSLTVFFDVKEGTGQYVQAGFARNITSGDNKVVFGTKLGYVVNNKYMGLNDNGKEFSGLYDAELYLTTSFKIGKHFTVEPMIAYSMPLSQDGKEAIRNMSVNKESKNLYGGVTIHASF
jgi:hypothetical protein